MKDKINNILNYYHDNPGCDPNVNEFIMLCRDFGKYLYDFAPNYGIYGSLELTEEQARKKYPDVAAVSDQFRILSDEFFKKLLGNDLDITEDSPLYELCMNSLHSAVTYGFPRNAETNAKVGGVALYIAQQKRNVRRGIIPSFVYDNVTELNEINQLHTLMPLDMHYDDRKSPREMLVNQINEEYSKGLDQCKIKHI